MNRRDLIVDATERYIAEHGYSPTVRELAALVGLASPSTVHAHLMSLAREGRVSWDPARPRTLRPVPVETVEARCAA